MNGHVQVEYRRQPMFKLFRRLVSQRSNDVAIEFGSSRGMFSEVFDDIMFPELSIRVQTQVANRRCYDEQVSEAYAFLTERFYRLAEEQAKDLAKLAPSDLTDTNDTEFEVKLCLIIRLIVRQADLRFRKSIVDSALLELGHVPFRFRAQNKIT
jgi:hypothetical protein